MAHIERLCDTGKDTHIKSKIELDEQNNHLFLPQVDIFFRKDTKNFIGQNIKPCIYKEQRRTKNIQQQKILKTKLLHNQNSSPLTSPRESMGAV